jgi:ketosteroid isomerase-like protein
VQQHVLRGVAPNGTALEIPACIVCTVRDGRIVRLEEYLDSAHTAPLTA